MTVFIWGSGYNVTNYNFSKHLTFKQQSCISPLWQDVCYNNSMCASEIIAGETTIVKSPYETDARARQFESSWLVSTNAKTMI